MKRGELIILWVGGILSSLLLIVVAINLPGAGTLDVQVVITVFLLLAIWIICGLVWLTLYRRAPK